MILILRDGRSNRRQAGLDGRHTCGGAGHVELLANAGFAPHARQAESVVLIFQIPLGDGEPLLPSSQLEVVACDLRCDDDTDVGE